MQLFVKFSCLDDVASSETKRIKRLEMLKFMSKARKDGLSLKVRYGKVLICGASAAGKTNFFNLLMEDYFQPDHISTKVAEPQQVTIAVKAQLSKNDDKIEFTKMDIDSEIDQLRLYLRTSLSIPANIRSSDEVQLQESSEHKIREKCTIAEVIICDKLADSDNFDKGDDSNAEISPTHIQHSKKVWDIVTFMDTGGQPQLINMLPAVNDFAMITFIVHNMTGGKSSLTDKVLVKHGNESGQDSFKPYRLDYSYHQLIETLMSYASSVLLPDKEFLNDYKTTVSGACNKGTNTSSISFIGTNSDGQSLSEEDIKEIDDELIKTINNSGKGNIKQKTNTNYKYLVPVDSKTQEKDKIKADTNNKRYTDPLIIRRYVCNWLEKQDVYDVPIQWLLLELEIRKVCLERNCNFMMYDEVLKLSRDKDLGDEDSVINGLEFHHFFGVLLYFELKGMPKLVITDHQWLFDKLNEIFELSQSVMNKGDLNNAENETCKSGVFNKEILNQLKISKDFQNCGIKDKLFNPNMYFLKLLQHLRIVAFLNEDCTDYFMPSLLDSCDLTNVQSKVPEQSKFMTAAKEIRDSEPLLIQFKAFGNTSLKPFQRCNNNYFPRGIFCFLVVQLIYSAELMLTDEPAYDNFVIFIYKKTSHYITIIDRIFFLEIQVTHKSENCGPVHDIILNIIVKALFEVGNILNININLEYGFWCRECKTSNGRHISILDEHYNHAYCFKREPTTLEISHKVWLKVCAHHSNQLVILSLVDFCMHTQ